MKQNHWTVLIFILFLGFLTACNPNTTEPPKDSENTADSSAVTTNNATDKEEEKEAPISFKTEKHGDETIGISYVVMEGGSEEAREAINKAILKAVIDAAGNQEAKDPADAIEKFKAMAKNAPMGMGDMFGLDIKCSEPYVGKNIISLAVNWYAFEGGAHPNTASFGLNFDRKTGKQLSNDDIITDKAALMAYAERKFREKEKLGEKGNINANGHMFPDDKFVLPKHIIYTKDGLLLYYIPYEIAPYVMGGTELKFPYDEVKDMIKKG